MHALLRSSPLASRRCCRRQHQHQCRVQQTHKLTQQTIMCENVGAIHRAVVQQQQPASQPANSDDASQSSNAAAAQGKTEHRNMFSACAIAADVVAVSNISAHRFHRLRTSSSSLPAHKARACAHAFRASRDSTHDITRSTCACRSNIIVHTHVHTHTHVSNVCGTKPCV